MKKDSILVDIIFIFHFLIAAFFPLGFFIPSSVWPLRIEFHFYYTLSIFLLFFIWGLPYTLRFKDKLYGRCVLDTLMQKLRGYSFWDKKNYQHSFVEEFTRRFAPFTITGKMVPLLALISTILAAILFVLKLNGIVLY